VRFCDFSPGLCTIPSGTVPQPGPPGGTPKSQNGAIFPLLGGFYRQIAFWQGYFRFLGGKNHAKSHKMPQNTRFRVILGVKWVFFAPPHSRRGVVGGGVWHKKCILPPKTPVFGENTPIYREIIGFCTQKTLQKWPNAPKYPGLG
jgi:hypothetical protein